MGTALIPRSPCGRINAVRFSAMHSDLFVEELDQPRERLTDLTFAVASTSFALGWDRSNRFFWVPPFHRGVHCFASGGLTKEIA